MAAAIVVVVMAVLSKPQLGSRYLQNSFIHAQIFRILSSHAQSLTMDETPILFARFRMTVHVLLPHNVGVPPTYAHLLPARKMLAARIIAAAA